MHTKRYRRLSLELCEEAVATCFSGKYRRRDVLAFIEKYAGIPREEIKLEELTGSRAARNEAIASCGAALYETMTEILSGHDPEDVDPVLVRSRPDGMTGKVRDIALLCIMHQLIGHAVKLMLDPLFDARILPTQHASLPGHGQTRLKEQMRRYFASNSLGVAYVEKTDVVHAYQSTKYQVVLGLIRKELPKAYELHKFIEYLGRMAPEGHLIIGGYLDAWLFNLCMSYAIQYLYTLGTTRRGKFKRYVIRCGTFMDDFALLTSSIKGLQRATNALDDWTRENLGLRLKLTTGILKLLPKGEERARKKEKQGTAKRGCPVLDMAGFKICRGHVAIRRRVFIRARRQFLRGWAELKRDGTLRRVRAQKVISYHSYIKQTDSAYLKEKYHIEELMATASKVCGFYSNLDHKKRMEALYDLQERRSRRETRAGSPGKNTRPDDRPPGRQHPDLRNNRRHSSNNVPF